MWQLSENICGLYAECRNATIMGKIEAMPCYSISQWRHVTPKRLEHLLEMVTQGRNKAKQILKLSLSKQNMLCMFKDTGIWQQGILLNACFCILCHFL